MDMLTERIYDEFVEKAKVRALKRIVGDPFKKGVEQGPQFSKILRYIKSGINSGATLVTGGDRIGNKGYYIQPTIFSDVQDEMKIAQDEIYGPVQSILKFRQIDLRILKAVALEHPNDIDDAAESILVEILPSIATSHESSFSLQDANEVVRVSTSDGKGKQPVFYEHQEEERTSNHLSGNELVVWENTVSSHGPTSASTNTGTSYSKRYLLVLIE
ncbi:hypothetical protein ZIOFF_068165 [Zingiber officinale]|uniref:Aldehyde dehydrogenase domain-containing protein n=1 Tax=Zingiber officinale TaxID=94328 RepID=A0A8J5CD98_ZINOF|nr:hypothetical protein ZIOFF_068165 [Zingiber officinale]